MRDAQQLSHFRAPNDIIRYTTEELLNITAQYVASEEAVGPLPIPSSKETVPGSSQVAPSIIVVQVAKKDAKGGKKKQKRCL
jgi:hypothetical protein